MRGQEGGEEIILEGGQYPLFSTTMLFCETNDEITQFRLLVRLQQLAKRSDRQESRYKRVACF